MHTRFSDGKGEPAEWAAFARSNGFTAIGFSEHSPLPFDNTFALNPAETQAYVETIRLLKSEWAGKMDLYCGMEMDYIPGISEGFDHKKRAWGLDYLIGSVHLVLNEAGDALWFTDGPSHLIYDDGLKILFGGDIRKAVGAYFSQILRMLSEERFDIIGHFDKVKMHNKNRYFTEEETWYRDWILQCLHLIAEKGIILEINTRGIYKKRSESTFPSPWILQEALRLQIPMMLSSDAHQMQEIDAEFNETLSMLKAIGIRELAASPDAKMISLD